MSPEFDLGMDDFVDDDAFEPPRSKRRLPGKENDDAFEPPRLKLRLQGKENASILKKSKRYEDVFNVSEQEFCKMSKPFVAKNTQKNNDWAYNNFQSWVRSRNDHFPEARCPEDLLDKTPWDVKALSYWLCRYVCETRKADGSKYPPSSLHGLLAGLLRHMRSIDPGCPNIMDTSNVLFCELHSTVDATFRKLREEGVGAEVKHASLITKQEENLLWEKGILGTKSPLSLLRAVFFNNGKNFHLRGGKESRNLKISQLTRFSNPDRYVYTENGSKNHSGAFCQLRVENKVVPILAQPECGDRCPVHLLDLYFSKLPSKAYEMEFSIYILYR